MKKSILLVAAIFSIAVIFTSCKESKKEEVKTESHEGHDHESDSGVTSKEAYKCPMDCEKGKSYEEAGVCPVCKMDLKKQLVENTVVSSCKSKEGVAKSKECGKCDESSSCKSKDGVAKAKECGNCDKSSSCKSKDGVAKAKECGKCDEGSSCKSKEVVAKAKECSNCEPGSCECKA